MNEHQETLHFLDYWRVIRSRKEVVIAVSFLVVLTGVAVTYQMPKVYEATCIIEVTRESPGVDLFARERIGFDPWFLRTQFEVIQSRPVLEQVIDELGLVDDLAQGYGYNDRPPKKQWDRTYRLLAGGMKVQHYRDTRLIEIRTAMSEFPDDPLKAPKLAADVADQIALAYRSQSLRRSRDNKEGVLEALRQSYEEQQAKVVAAKTRVEELRQKYKISIVNPAGYVGATLDKEGIRLLEVRRIDALTNLAKERARWESIQSLSEEKLLSSVPYITGDVAVSGLVAEKRRLKIELEGRLQSLGPKHPDVMDLQASKDEVDREIASALEGMKRGIQVAYEAEKARVELLEAELDRWKDAEIKAESSGYQEFEKAVEELAHARAIRNELEIRHVEKKIELQIPQTTVEIIQPAKPPDVDDTVSPNLLLNMVLSILLGMGAGVGLAYFIEYLDTSVKTIGDIETQMGVPVLGVIPQKVKPLIAEGIDSPHAEAYRVLRTNIQFSKKFKGGKTFCITSGSVGEGKSLTTFNLACVCAHLGDTVLLVDSDLHRPKQHRFLGVSNGDGLANMLVGEAELEEVIVETEVPNLYFLPSGQLRSAVHGLMDTSRMRETVQLLREAYDKVFFDAPPIIGVSDASLLSREMDAVLLVIQHRKYPKAVSTRAQQMLENVGANLIGVVLNNINMSRDHSHYYYYSSYYSPYNVKRNTEG